MSCKPEPFPRNSSLRTSGRRWAARTDLLLELPGKPQLELPCPLRGDLRLPRAIVHPKCPPTPPNCTRATGRGPHGTLRLRSTEGQDDDTREAAAPPPGRESPALGQAGARPRQCAATLLWSLMEASPTSSAEHRARCIHHPPEGGALSSAAQKHASICSSSPPSLAERQMESRLAETKSSSNAFMSHLRTHSKALKMTSSTSPENDLNDERPTTLH